MSTLTAGDVVAKRGKHKGGRGKKDKRKRGVRSGVVKKVKAAGLRRLTYRAGTWT